jgi:hypothetical protein
MDVHRVRRFLMRSNLSASSCRPGASPIPAHDSENSSNLPRPPQPRRSSATPARFILLTGVCPTVALHVLWDCPEGVNSSTDDIKKFSDRYGVLPGSINPNLFQDQEYKYGSFGNPDPAIRQRALQHTKDSIEIARRLNSRDVSMWFADGSNYPGTANIRQRKQWFTEGLKESHSALSAGQRLLIEYKPFEPAFYHTDIADWGMSLLSRAAGWPKPVSWSIPGITMQRRTLSKSLPGCCRKRCWEAFTLTIAVMPMMT